MLRRCDGLRLAALVLCLVCWAKTGSALEPEAPPAPPSLEPKTEHWYGAEILAADGASLALGIWGARSLELPALHRPSQAALTIGIWWGLGALGSQAVHYAHDNTKRGLIALAARTLMPSTFAFGALLGGCLRGGYHSDCVNQWATGGATVGVVAAAAADAFGLARRMQQTELERSRRWYGAPILAIDTVGLVWGIHCSDPERCPSKGRRHPPIALRTWATGMLGAPIVHFLHGQTRSGFLSFSLRFIAPAVPAIPAGIGYCAVTGFRHDCFELGAQYGLLAGSLSAALFDALVLARSAPQGSATAAPLQVLATPTSVTIGGTW